VCWLCKCYAFTLDFSSNAFLASIMAYMIICHVCLCVLASQTSMLSQQQPSQQFVTTEEEEEDEEA